MTARTHWKVSRHRRSSLGAAFIPLVALLLLVGCSSESTLDTRPEGVASDIEDLTSRTDLNVLFVLIDTLRADHLSSYGYNRLTSPTLDYIASTGIRFTRHISQSSWTKSSMASLWTSLYPQHNGVLRFDDALPPDATLPAEILRQAGFRTAGIWRNGWVAPIFGFAQGFEIYQRPVSRPPPPDLHREKPHLMLKGTDDDVIEEAVTFIRTRRDERWFLYLHLMDVHQFVYDEDTAVFGTARSDLYDNSVLREDKLINRLFSELSRERQLSKTLVIIASDHGEAFLERGIEGHARDVYRETTEVPLVISFPFRLPRVEVSELTRNVDVWPTILDLLGLPPLSSSDGRSLLPEIAAATSGTPPTGQPVPDSRVAFSHLDRTWGRPGDTRAPTVSIVTERFRMIYSRDEAGVETQQLYDHQLDPKELKEVGKEHPDVLAAMVGDIRRYLESPSEAWARESGPVDLDEMQLKQLRALGYSIAR